ncbi:hypothetical protein TNCV_446771 [Trichonephila clavipes]|nr:hypothetical protein TNCV_446771 [Trichonephila clavipes]
MNWHCFAGLFGGWRNARMNINFFSYGSKYAVSGYKSLVLPNLDIGNTATHSPFLILFLPNNEMTQKSPFSVQNALTEIGGNPKPVSKLHFGDLLIVATSAL